MHHIDTQIAQLRAEQAALESLSNELNDRLKALRKASTEFDDTPDMVAIIFAVGGMSQRHQEITLAISAASDEARAARFAAAGVNTDVEHDA